MTGQATTYREHFTIRKKINIDDMVREITATKSEESPRVITQPDPFAALLATIEKSKDNKNLKKVEGLSFDVAASKIESILKRLTKNENIKYNTNNKEILGNLALYFLNDSSCKYDLSKGLYLYGNTGSGKTTILKAFSLFTKVTRIKKFRIASAKEIVRKVTFENNAASLESYTLAAGSQGEWAIDDLGHEHECNVFGTKINCLEIVLTARYDRGLLTHCTSNLKPARIKEMYGQRLFSRMHEMFNFIEIKEADHRIKQ